MIAGFADRGPLGYRDHPTVATWRPVASNRSASAQLLAGPEFLTDDVSGQFELGRHGEMRTALAEHSGTEPRDEWTVIFTGTDARITPVLSWSEAADDEHLLAHRTWVNIDGWSRRHRPRGSP